MTEQVLKPAAVILAAGRSQRFGAPKVLQSFNGIPFLTKIRTNLQKSGITEIILVLGHQANELISKIPDGEHFRIVVNRQYDLGQLSSLQAGLQEIPPALPGVMMCLIDQPHVTETVYQTLLRSAEQYPASFLIPESKGRGGHPIFIPALFFPEIMNAYAAHSTLKDVMRAHSNHIKRIPVSDPGILEDIDTQEKLLELQQKYR